jgi:hypothetical protein
VEHEVEATPRNVLKPREYRFHFLCHAAWQLECARYEHLQRVAGS